MRACPSCGESHALSEIADVPVARPAGQPGDAIIRVLTCDVCGLGFSDDGITQEQLNAYYAKLAKYGDLSLYSKDEVVNASLDSEAPWELERAEALADFVSRNVPVDAHVFDVGCSTGTLMELLRRRGFLHIRGCDPLESAVTVARDQRGLDVEQGWVGSLDASQKIDVIVLSHVLEHVLELQGAIEQLCARLVSGGAVVIEVPDASRFADFVHAPYQDFNTEHVNHFSPDSLSFLMRQFGFEEVQLDQVMIRSGPSHPYPAIRGCWRRRSGLAAVFPPASSVQAHRAALARYAAVSETMFRQIDQRIIAGVGVRPFVLWGAGQLAMKILNRPTFPDTQLIAIVDSAPTRVGVQLKGQVVTSPTDVAGTGWPDFIVAGSIFAEDAIARQAASLGFVGVVVGLSAATE